LGPIIATITATDTDLVAMEQLGPIENDGGSNGHVVQWNRASISSSFYGL